MLNSNVLTVFLSVSSVCIFLTNGTVVLVGILYRGMRFKIQSYSAGIAERPGVLGSRSFRSGQRVRLVTTSDRPDCHASRGTRPDKTRSLAEDLTSNILI